MGYDCMDFLNYIDIDYYFFGLGENNIYFNIIFCKCIVFDWNWFIGIVYFFYDWKVKGVVKDWDVWNEC